MDYDVIVIGSGFGGSVSALRLTEKGYRVGVLEAGRRRDERTLPKSSRPLRDYLWLPGLGLRGIQRMHVVRGTRGAGVMVLAGSGVGGGSLVDANTLDVPPDKFFGTGEWAAITDWKAELAPYYDQAKRMLGVVTSPADRVMRQVAMLIKNYLDLAERAGAVVHPDNEVTSVRPLPHGGYQVFTQRPGPRRGRVRVFTAGQVVFAAGTHGTQRLLHFCKSSGALPRLSDRLGVLTRTQAGDNSVTLSPRRGRLHAMPGEGEPSPSRIPAGRRAARAMGGHPSGSVLDLFGIPASAHFLGGCVIGATAADGVVDPYHRVHGYQGLHVVDGSSVPANPGVSPSLTITALAERAMALWPNKGDADPRPAAGRGYTVVEPVLPARPVVPADAPRLPVAVTSPAGSDGTIDARRPAETRGQPVAMVPSMPDGPRPRGGGQSKIGSRSRERLSS